VTLRNPGSLKNDSQSKYQTLNTEENEENEYESDEMFEYTRAASAKRPESAR
jgi:hypothetical protein